GTGPADPPGPDAPARQQPVRAAVEADEQAAADQARHLALKRPALVDLLLAEVEREADRIAAALEPRPLPLALGQRHGEVVETVAVRHRPEPERAQQRAVDGDVGIAADRGPGM